jgi:Flp pilus assembly protein TadD
VPVPLPSPEAARPRARAEAARAVADNREGKARFERGDLAGAVARFRRAVAAVPENASYHNNLGWALFRSGRVDEAARELAEAVRLDPHDDVAYANLGELERARGNTAAAIAAYERFLELNTDPRRERIARETLRALRGQPDPDGGRRR